MRNREQETILDELKFYPTVSVINKEANGGKHKFVEVRLPNGASHKLQWSSTANDGNYRRILNVRLMVRKRMRTLCIERVIPIKSKPVTNDVVDRLPRNPVRVAPPVAVEQPSILAYQQPKPQESSVTKSKEPEYTKLTHIQVITCGKILEENSTIENDVRSYNEGWSDDRVAKVLSAAFADRPCNADQVSYLRRAAYPGWKLKTTPGPRKVGSILDRLTSIEQRLQALEDAATAPRPSPYAGSQQASAGAHWGNGTQQKANY